MADDEVQLAWDEEQEGVAVVTLHRPERMNALTVSLGDAFERVMRELSGAERLRAVVLTGAGKAFSAGGDLAFLEERASSSALENSEAMRAFYRRYLSVRELPVPVVAAVNGAAIGAGLCLALACDIRVCAKDAKLGFTFVGLGLHPGMGASFLLPALVGHQVASRMLLTGEVLSGAEARELGLVLEAVDVDQVLPRASSIARAIAAQAPIAVRSAVRSLRLVNDEGLERALWREADAQAHCYASEDIRRGIEAVREKKRATFLGK